MSEGSEDSRGHGDHQPWGSQPGPGTAGMAADEPLPPYGTPAFERREGLAMVAALRILVAYLGIYRRLPSADPDTSAEVIAEEIAALRPSDTVQVVNGFRRAETAFGDPAPGGFPPDGDRWREAARPVMLQLCPPSHRDAALVMMDHRIAAETSPRTSDTVDAYIDASSRYPVATIHAEAALRSWMFTQPGLMRAGLQADLKITEFLLRG
jgi:hypothetical protein